MTTTPSLPPDDDAAWEPLRSQWSFPAGTIYLNHGSFGPPPACVRRERQRWLNALDAQPMDFFTRQLEPAWLAARAELATYLHARPDDLAFIENATAGMNIVADSFPLGRGDEVLLTDHEYGAVRRIWERRCAAVGAKVTIARLPWPMTTAADVVAAIEDAATPATRLLVVSHITSPTAVTLPLANIIAWARRREIATCVDGPHALWQLPVDLTALDADYYVASCHKWLSAPFGSGFVWVHTRRHDTLRVGQLSWGRQPPLTPQAWWEEFVWPGTRDPAAYLAVPAAIRFAREVGEDSARGRVHYLAQRARQMLEAISQRASYIPDDPAWYTAMAHVPLPPGDARSLQTALWQRAGIEVPIVAFGGERFIRVSCHLYNTLDDLAALAIALKQCLAA
jgi:isopenicillin-N epimerase